jgi:glycerophosphoryl diester phosphodiesterase
MAKSGYTPGVFSQTTVIVGSAKPKPPIFVLRPRHVFGAVAAVFFLIALYLFGYEPVYTGKLVIQAPRPLILASRSVGSTLPENSLQAVDRALNAGLDGVGAEAQLASGDRLTVSLGGTTLGTFQEFVRSIKGRGLATVELDAPGTTATGIERMAVEIIRRYDAHLSVVLSSSNPMVLWRVKQIDPLVRTSYISVDSESEAKANVSWIMRQEVIRRAVRKFVQVDLLSVDHRVDDAVTDRLISKGWPVLIWGPGTEPEIRGVIARHPYGVISDQATLVRGLRGD